MAQPWLKFYPQDWRSDEKLRLCSLAARGLWIEMLSLMHRAERYGQLLIGGVAPTPEQLAVQVGASASEVSILISELENAGVFSRTGAGVMYSRRMKMDQKKSENARKNGKKGGNPSLGKQTGNKASVNLVDKGEDKTQIPEARSQRLELVTSTVEKTTAGDAPDGASTAYAFSGNVIRLKEADLSKWRHAYHAIPDIEAELFSLDAWFQGDGAPKAGKWFFTTAGALNRKHQEMMEARRAEQSRPKVPL